MQRQPGAAKGGTASQAPLERSLWPLRPGAGQPGLNSGKPNRALCLQAAELPARVATAPRRCQVRLGPLARLGSCWQRPAVEKASNLVSTKACDKSAVTAAGPPGTMQRTLEAESRGLGASSQVCCLLCGVGPVPCPL